MAKYKDFILDDDLLEQEEHQKGTTRKTEVSYETVFVSGPDWAVRRKTKTTSRILACMMTADQFYIKNEMNGDIQKLDERSLGSFLARCDGEEIMDEKGESPFWVKKLYSDKSFREALWCAINSNGDYRDALKSGYVLLSYNNTWTTQRLTRLVETLGDGLLRSVFSGLTAEEKDYFRLMISTPGGYCRDGDLRQVPVARDRDHVGDNLKKINGLLSAVGACGNSYYARRDGYITPDSVNQDNLRYLVERYMASPATTLPDIARIRGVCQYDRYNYNDVRGGAARLDERKVIDHCMDAGVEQGYGDDMVNFSSCWADYLDQQQTVYGRLVDKYPDNLASSEKRLAYVYRKKEALIRAEHFEEAANKMKEFRYENNDFLITSPEQPVDMVDESKNMSNCLSSYVNSVADGRCMIFFLRQKEKPDKSYVDIEICEDGSLGQVLSRFNRQPSPSALDFVHEWHEEFFCNSDEE